ncbi:ROK family protein [Teichococcus deserti]|uniref:ROK family protein n=1 Tax=Teichococcus deserti TaxID=1817963 RepID=UPI0013F69C28|nr:ROK family protein [Pseudoroseomonas deserti]
MPDEARFEEPAARDRARVLSALAGGRLSSRPEMVEQLGLRSTTASRCVAELLQRRLVLEASGEKLGRGRPAARLMLNPRRLGVAVIHVVSRAFVGMLLDLGGQAIAREVLPVPAEADNKALGTALAALAGRLKATAPRGMAHAGTVVCISGVVDVGQRRWLVSSRWPRMRHLDIAAAVDPVAGPVQVVRQLDAELRAQALADPDAYAEGAVLLHWGWGIGMGYAVAGEPFGAAGGPFGEIGHWRVAAGKRCGCGGEGCLETVAALWSLLPLLRRRWPELADDEDRLLEQLRHLDLVAVPAMRAAAAEVARALANLCRILFPARVMISSPLMGNARFWAEFEALFRAEGLMEEMPPPPLHHAPPSAGRGMMGAAGPLLGRALEELLR